MQGMNFKKQRERFEARHPEITKKYKSKRAHAYHLKYTHGMTQADYSTLLRVQKGRCAICERTPKEVQQAHLSVDHCHETGRVRGLLCSGCNSRVEAARENPYRAARQIAYRDALMLYIVTRCVRGRAAGPI